MVKTHLSMQEMKEMQALSLGQEDPLEEGMATHSSILAWRIPWIEEPGGLWAIGLQRVGHDGGHMLLGQIHSTVLTLLTVPAPLVGPAQTDSAPPATSQA